MSALVTRVVLPAVLVVLGVGLTISERSGWFRDATRAQFVQAFKDGTAAPETPGGAAFMDRFFFPKAGPSEPKPVRFVHTGMNMAGVKNGAVRAQSPTGRTGTVCSVAELEAWAQESPAWVFWTGVVLTLVGMGVALYTGLQDWREKRVPQPS